MSMGKRSDESGKVAWKASEGRSYVAMTVQGEGEEGGGDGERGNGRLKAIAVQQQQRRGRARPGSSDGRTVLWERCVLCSSRAGCWERRVGKVEIEEGVG